MAACVAVVLTLIGAYGPARAQDDRPFASCIDALRQQRPQHPQVRAETFDKYTREVRDIRSVIRAATEDQPEFKLPIWDYIARLVDAQRVVDGKQALAAQAAPLKAIASRHGVDAETVVAVFGIETDYGRIEDRYPVVDTTLSRACLDLKSKERKRHLFAALWLLQEGLVQPDRFLGSWAGAFGLTQFMPGTFVNLMDDGDGSGTVDIIGSAPDALATTARYIASLGWTDGLRWGIEVSRPAASTRDLVAAEREHACVMQTTPAGKCRTIEQWAALGVTAVGGTSGAIGRDASLGLPKDTRAALLAPGGDAGPAWLVTRNYRAIWQYNRADAYALAIGLLSDALRGDPPMRAAWATDDPGISRAQLRQLQQDLIRQGHADVVADGFDGPRTQDAIRAEEKLRGWVETGRAGARIAQTLDDGPLIDKAAKQPAPVDAVPLPQTP